MTFAQRLDLTARLIETRLNALLADEIGPSGAEAGVSPRLSRAMRHAALGGGKRLRPFLVIESAALFGLKPSEAIEAATAIECVHCYSLVHDDLPAMDNDELRRGQPTVWKEFDEWTAILAGDGLLTLAFEVLSGPLTHTDPNIRLALISGLAKAAGVAGMAGGQCLDLEAEKIARPAPASAAQIQRIHNLKTGALIAFSCEAGAILGHGRDQERTALRTYGESLGLAFQMADDILDASGSALRVGKKVAKDAAAGKATLVSIAGLDGARAELARVMETAVAALSVFGERAAILAEAAYFVASRQH